MIKSNKTIIKKSLCMILAILIAIMIMPDIDLKVKAAGSITVDLPTKTATGSCAVGEELKLYPYQLFGLTSDDYNSHDGFTYGFTQPANENGKIYNNIDISELAADGVYNSYMTYDNTDYMTFKAGVSGTYTFHAECLDSYDLSTFNTCEITITVGASTPKYTVSFDSNGGSAVSDKTDITSGLVITAPTPAPTKSGYAFGGWYKDDDTFLDDWDFANDTVTANTTLHAKWTDNTAPTVVSITRADSTPTKATSVSYTVTFSEDVTGVDTYDFTSIASGVSHTLWTVTGSGKTYTVTINGISGSGTFQLFSAEIGTGIKDLAGNDVVGEYTGEIYTIDTIPPLITGVENNQIYTSEVTPACSESGIVVSLLKNGSEVSGYNFEKISTNGDYTLSVTDSVGNVSTINFTVDIPETYTVSFNTVGGSANPESQIITENGYVIAPADPTKTGCDFLGWYNGSTKWNFATDKVTSNITLTAHWKNAQYTVSFNTDGGSIAPENQTIDYNNYANIPADPTKTGCDFLGWYNGSTKWNFATDKVTSNISLTAHWKIQQFIVSFNTDGGSTAPGNQTINYNNYANIPSDPTKTGCDFLGWYNGSTKWNFATDKVTGNIILTAHWKNAQYTVSFNTDGGSIAPENQTIDYNNYANIPADPTKTGCDFLGWYNGSTKWNFATDKVTSNVTLTAHWKIQKTITIIEAPAEIKNPDLISVAPQGEAFDHPVEVRMKNDPAVKQAITKAIDDKITSEIKDITVFPLDISLYIKGTDTKVQPNSGTSVVITCPIPENLIANKDKIKVVCLIDGKLTILDTKIVLVNGVYCAQFKATHFSPYAMVVDKANELSNTTNPQTSGNDTVAAFSIIAILSVVTLAVVRKKYKFKVVK